MSVESERHNRAILKARNRGNVSAEWHKTNKLTPETFAEFKQLMKKADKDFEKLMEQKEK